ncbi:HD-GYP domain, c-di-GMP phosphodiesterase class II (or its inactivated variant) [Desulfuromonas thiophila]|jgi:HD-GYP domain-containing protein (c-di-GMP phosphodiesterase class II)|uniref:HD-GYP domain, c-di-GMP phosphodiesterase class II (Or its inactivated variant) n=2 Tax=Desulfuromonas thiophila TaxID=57664 RepID=A0A1G6XZ25_9BACT|nr:HD-GYP domain, c-di-GMP phosphodiesterase class II (or its inactivated variant) [Desulfuromonas thiophila]
MRRRRRTARTKAATAARAAAAFRQVQEMALLLNSQRHFDDLFRAVIQSVSRILQVDRTSLFVFDEERQQLWTQVAEGVSGVIRLSLQRGLAGRCAREQRPLLVADAQRHPDFDASWDRKHGYRSRNILCYPLFNRQQELKGVLQMINRRGGAFTPEDLELAAVCAAQVGVALENRQLFEELRQGFESFIRALTATIDAKHPLTAGHSHRVTEYALLLGRSLQLDAQTLDTLQYAALLHDVGKIAVPDRVLTKDGRFDTDEQRLMQGHSAWSGRILEQMRLPRHLRQLPFIAASHHERMDGSGYPAGLDATAIPPLARIIAIADVFDALTSRRDYPKYAEDGLTSLGYAPLALERAFTVIAQGRGSHFDAALVDVFLARRPELEALWHQLHASEARDEAGTAGC